MAAVRAHGSQAPPADETIHTSANHPWLTRDRGWVQAGDLHAGEAVVTLDGGTSTVAWVRVVPGQAEYYNLTVAQDHTYAMGTTQAVVHNANCSPQEHDIVKYGQDVSGFEKHHGIMDAWAREDIPTYVGERPYGSPTVVLSKADHAATKEVLRDWLEDRTGVRVGSKVDWSQVSPREVYALSERMFDAASVPRDVRADYYRAFNQYIYTGSFDLK